MNLPFNPIAKRPHRYGFGLPIFENGCGVPMMWEAFLQSALLVVRLLCSGRHNSRYVALVKMRRWTSKPSVFNRLSSFEYHIRNG